MSARLHISTVSDNNLRNHLMSTKDRAYCRILDYLDDHDEELAELARATCVDMTLGNPRSKTGITLLSPDKDTRAMIKKLAYSSNPAEASRACDILNAHILRGSYASGADFKRNSDNIPNSLYPSQKVVINGVTGDVVTFASGATASPAKFVSAKGNLAVWILKGGSIPTDGAVAKDIRPARGGKSSKAGGYSQSVADDLSKKLRWQIAITVESEYALSHQKRSLTGSAEVNPFVRCVMSLVQYIHKKNPELLRNEVLPLLSLGPIDFYFLVEPHSQTGSKYLLSEDIISGWWAERATHSGAEGCELVGMLLSENAGRESELIDQITKIRKTVYSQCRDRGCVKVVEKVYQELSANNRIGSVANVFPDATASKYRDDPELKMLQDELRFLAHCGFTDLEKSAFDAGSFNQLVQMIAEYMYKLSGLPADRNAGRKLLNDVTLRYAIQPTDKIEAIGAFVQSTCFLHIPVSREGAVNMKQKNSVDQPETGSNIVWNVALGNYETHARGTYGNKDLEAALAACSPEVADRIRAALWK